MSVEFERMRIVRLALDGMGTAAQLATLERTTRNEQRALLRERIDTRLQRLSLLERDQPDRRGDR